MLKVALCDDVPQMAEAVEKLLYEYDPMLFDSHVYYHSTKLKDQIHQTSFDLYILDIEMPHYDGLTIAKEIRKNDLNVPIVFLTNYKEYMEDVFSIHTFDYVIKPINKERFFLLLDRITKYLSASRHLFSFVENKSFFKIQANDIVYFEKNRRQVFIHSTRDTHSSYMSTQEIVKQLNHHFVQIHASYIINLNYIREIGKNYIVLKNTVNEHIELPISRKFKEQALKKILMTTREKLS
ncbi:LytTr DNA-binding domain protein [Enterococcus faecalis 13-SD-W-01]|nr:LytTr DNA-binding domain protein [Enterococcus faecalis 13-SD-W-01]